MMHGNALRYYLRSAADSQYLVMVEKLKRTLAEHRGKTSAHAPNYENMAGNLNINF
jgi:hypothetical protein